MKKTCGWLVLLSLLWTLLPRVAAADDAAVSLYVNGRQASVSDTPQIIHKVPYLSSRDIEAHIGAKVELKENASQIVITKSGRTSTLSTSNQTANQVGQALPFQNGGGWYIPLSALDDHDAIKALWDPITSSIFVYLSEAAVQGNNGAAIPIPGSTEDLTPVPDKGSGEAEMPVEDIAVAPIENGSVAGGQESLPQAADGPTTIASISFSGNEFVIAANGYMMVEHFSLAAPERIVIDLSNAVLSPSLSSGQNGGTITVQHQSVSQIRYSQTGNAVRLVLDMKQKSAYALQADASGIRIGLGEALRQSYVVVVDPGHGGKDPGAPSLSGKVEKDFNLSTSILIAEALRKVPGVEVHLTRTTDEFIELAERGQIANRLNADLFISVHGNTVDKPVSGIETYYWHRESFDFASLIHQKIVSASGMNDRNVRRNDWKVLTTAQMPGVLLELGYLSSSRDEPIMWTVEYQQAIAGAVAETVKEYFGIQ